MTTLKLTTKKTGKPNRFGLTWFFIYQFGQPIMIGSYKVKFHAMNSESAIKAYKDFYNL